MTSRLCSVIHRFPTHYKHLQVHIAERTADSRQQVANRSGGSRSISELDLIIECTVCTWWLVQESLRSGDGIARELALVWREHLPDPPHTIDHTMMQIEHRVARAGKYIVTGIATDGIVAAAVDADLEEESQYCAFLSDVQFMPALTSPEPGMPCIVIWKS